MHSLSRLLRKKDKDATTRSTSNLSKVSSLSNTALDTSSQHNKISPIVNSPFEQTFRVTVYLPKNQLYVERIGAKTKLKKLMDDICENKLLQADQYEFRHPGDLSQAFDNEKTIGEVGLNELKLTLKTESRFNGFHANDMMRYKSESVSSSEISRNSKIVLPKTSSPYSSTTSLNSLDSTGMNLTAKMQPPVAPIRKKKRAAPRPPSQNSIPEQEIFSTSTLNVFKDHSISILPRKNFHVSSPHLFNNGTSISNDVTKSDKNNNIEAPENRLNAITRPTSMFVSPSADHAERQRTLSESSEIQDALSNITNSLEKKKKMAPVPPKRHNRPVPSPRTIQEEQRENSISEIKEADEIPSSQDKVVEVVQKETTPVHPTTNVSKVMLNNSSEKSQADEAQQPSSIGSDGSISIQILSSEKKVDEKNVLETKKEEPAKLPIISKVHIKPDEPDEKSLSDDDMTVNIYNITQKSVVTLDKKQMIVEEMKTESFIVEQKAVQNDYHVQKIEETIQKSSPPEIVKSAQESEMAIQSKNTELEKLEIEKRASSPLWTYTLPAPPVFADSSVIDKTSPTDQHKSDGKFFSDLISTADNETVFSDSNTTVVSTETQIQPIIRERKSLDESFTDTKPIADEESEKSTIEAITSDVEDGYLGNGNVVNVTSSSMEEANRAEKEIIVDDFKRNRLIITRSDSFHSIGQQHTPTKMNMSYSALSNSPQRSISYLSLVQAQKAEILNKPPTTGPEVMYNKQKSTSELSISDVPSLQSLEVIRNILNSSRKNSLQDSPPIAEDVPSPPEFKKEHAERIIKIEMMNEKAKEIATVEKQSSPIVDKKPEIPQYRYQGPPKINLGTWNERPKIEVSIKSDSDYKFGNVSAATLPRDFKKQDVSKRHTIHIPSTDETDNHYRPQTHRPKVLGVEYKKDIQEPEFKATSKSSTTIVNLRSRPVSVDLNSNTHTKLAASPTSPSYTNQSISFNRLSMGNKYTPVVHGFKLDNIKESELKSLPIGSDERLVPPNVPAKPSYIRSTSAGDISRHLKFTTTVEAISLSNDHAENSPFKVQLRKTGLKEKILHNDEKTESIFGRVIDYKKPTGRHSLIDITTDDKIDRTLMNRQISQPHPPPAPPKPLTLKKSASVEMNTRSELLDAIKGFNKDGLRKK